MVILLRRIYMHMCLYMYRTWMDLFAYVLFVSCDVRASAGTALPVSIFCCSGGAGVLDFDLRPFVPALHALLAHLEGWRSDEPLAATHLALLCELARWCKEDNVARAAMSKLVERMRLTRQQVRNLLNDLRKAGCIDFDPNYPAAKGNLRPTTLNVVKTHSQHVKPALPVQTSNMTNGLYLSPSQHVNPALPKSSKGGGR